MRKAFGFLVFLMLALFLGQNAASAQEPAFVFDPAVLCRKAEYRIEVSPSPKNPREFSFTAPNELITSMILGEGVLGAKAGKVRGRYKADIILGRPKGDPFDWRPAFGGGWGTTVRFNVVPNVVSIAVVSWDGGAGKVATGCGWWER